MREHDIAVKAFATGEWRSAADALFQATGVSVNAMDFERCVSLSAGQRCTYCHMAIDIDDPGPVSCFDTCPEPDAGPGRVLCRAGLAALYAPVMHAGRPIAHVVVSGFVTSTRERRGLYEQLISRGVAEESARRVMKALPVIPRRHAESYLEIGVATATTVVDATAERLAASERVEELRLFVSAGQQVVSTDRLDSDTLGGIAEEAVALVGGEAGAILCPRGTSLEVMARTESWRGPIGALVPMEATASGRAVDTKRTVMSPAGKTGTGTLAMPLTVSNRVLGVLEVRMSAEHLPIPKERLSRLNRFGQFVAIALEREGERVQVDRAMKGYGELNELAATLGGQTDVAGVSELILGVLDRAFEFGIGGLVLTGWGNDRADVILGNEVSDADLQGVLSIVSGRDVGATPFAMTNFVGDRHSTSDVESALDWAVATVEMSCGDLTVGSLFVARSDGDRYGAQDNALLEGIAAHAGAAFGRAALFAHIRDDYAKTIAALSATLDFGERAPAGHAGRVMEYAIFIAEELNLGFEAIEQLRFAGLLHDVGKTGVPAEILLKPTPLTPEEMAEMQRHAEIGASIVDQIQFLKSLTPVILHHHERWDGKGYPAGLSGEKIPMLARVLAVADSFDAMTTEKKYRKKMTIQQARIELEAAAGTQFDPRVVAALLEVLERQAIAGKTGLLVDLHRESSTDLPV